MNGEVNDTVNTPEFDPQRFRELLSAQGRRVEWLAAQTEYTPETTSRFIHGRQPISDAFATRAAKALGVPLDWLRTETPEPASVPA